MRFLPLLLSTLLILILTSPGSAKRPTSDLECQKAKGLCLHQRCRRPWRSVGTCNNLQHHCCQRGTHLPPMIPTANQEYRRK
ncbi:beta-defensin 1 [Anolis carolinensis]|nr:PREDICTED: beta-defensin 1 [Anolis carolinensis]CBY85064.1 beta-defensin-like protein 27 [Anolis carolinensis]|eukprot:XP_008119297.1 PREDICTED: beta-defensin 1 [Anolis carolinensis]